MAGKVVIFTSLKQIEENMVLQLCETTAFFKVGWYIGYSGSDKIHYIMMYTANAEAQELSGILRRKMIEILHQIREALSYNLEYTDRIDTVLKNEKINRHKPRTFIPRKVLEIAIWEGLYMLQRII